MKTILTAIIACIAFVPGVNHAQQITPPVVTYVPDNAGALHPVFGIPAAASVGAALNVGLGIREVSIPPAQDYLLAKTDGSTWPVLIQIHSGNFDVRSIQQSDSPIDQVALSPSGSAAALFSASEGRIYVLRNLSSSPVVTAQFQVGRLGAVSAFAISDSGTAMLVGVSDGTSGAVFSLNLNEEPRLIASVHHASAIQFLRQSNAAVIADDIENKVYGYVGGPLFPIAGEQDGIAGPVAIAVAADNTKAFVINSGSESVTQIGPYGVVAQPVHCDCTLTGLHATSTDSVFRVTDFSGGPVALFDGSSRVPRILLASADSHD